MFAARSPSTVELYTNLNRICDNFPHDVSHIERFVELATAVLELCNTDNAVCVLKSFLHQITLDPTYRLPMFFFTHEKARLRLRHVLSQVGSPQDLSTQTHHSALKLISGGPVSVSVMCPDVPYVNPNKSLRYIHTGTCILGSTLHLVAGSAICLQSTDEAAIIELSSPPILPYSAELDPQTGEVVSVHWEDRLAVRRDLLESALQLMLRSR